MISRQWWLDFQFYHTLMFVRKEALSSIRMSVSLFILKVKDKVLFSEDAK
jgi:hypothetical protein